MSLERLILKDFVIVQSLELDFTRGFTVLTGETGAGKSILIDALQLVLGARADTSFVREGCKRCEINAEFGLTPPIIHWLNQAGLLQDVLGTTEGAQIDLYLASSSEQSDVAAVAGSFMLRRQIDSEGKSRAWINGIPASATQLRALGEHLLDIHGQHAWQSLMRPKAVRGILDAFAHIDTTSTIQTLFVNWQATLKKWHDAQEKTQSLTVERERLQWQVSELEKLNPQEGEWEQLNLEQQRLSHAQALIDSAQGGLQALQAADEGQGAYALLYQAEQSLAAQAAIEPQFEILLKGLQTALAEVDDCRRALQQYLSHIEVDEGRLQYVDARMALWLELARRLRQTVASLPQCLLQWQARLYALGDLSDIATLQMQTQAAEKAYRKAAEKLTQARKHAAKDLAQRITGVMQALGMEGGRFAVQVTSDSPSKDGMDAVAFLVAGHAASTPKPLVKVASGGELSRIALAIAVTTSGLGQVPTLIFDEIDTGVGGAVARVVGRLMQVLGCERQVLAVTHLPQVAASAHQHLCVSKVQDASGVFSQVALLDTEARVLEIARMLGGGKSSSTSLAHAREMLNA